MAIFHFLKQLSSVFKYKVVLYKHPRAVSDSERSFNTLLGMSLTSAVCLGMITAETLQSAQIRFHNKHFQHMQSCLRGEKLVTWLFPALICVIHGCG